MILLLSLSLAAPFPEGADRVTFTDAANLRTEPSIGAKVVAELPLGTSVDVLKTGDKLTLWGRTESWLQVTAEGQTGWIWAGVLTDKFHSLGDGNGVAVGIRGVRDATEHHALVSVEVAARVGGALLEPARTDLGVPAAWSVQGVPFGIEIVKSGLPKSDPVIRLHYSAEYCGGIMGNMVWARHGDRMVHLATLHEGSDAPVFLSHDLVFPGEEGGKSGVVLRIEQSGEHLDDGTEAYEVNRTTPHTLVDGKLVPPLPEP